MMRDFGTSDCPGPRLPARDAPKARHCPRGQGACLPGVFRGVRDAVAHGFRCGFRDRAAECTDAPREVCELALAHVNSDRVEAAYRRSDLFDRRRVLMNDWAAHVA